MKKCLKTSFFFSLILMLLAGCGSGLSEEEKNRVEKFEIRWTAHLELADYAFSEMEKLEILIHKNHPDPANDTLPDDAKSKYELLSITQIKDLKTEYRKFLTSVEKPNKHWQKLKSKAMSEDADYADIESGMEELSGILEKNEKKILSWITQLEKIGKEESKK